MSRATGLQLSVKVGFFHRVDRNLEHGARPRLSDCDDELFHDSASTAGLTRLITL
jgi:hypothetical protein